MDNWVAYQVVLPLAAVPIIAVVTARAGVWPSLVAVAAYLAGLFWGIASSNPWDSSAVSALADASSAAATIMAVAIGWRGLRSWHDDLRGRSDYDLARRVLVAVYGVRRGFQIVRDSTMTGDEWWDRPGRDAADTGCSPENATYAYKKRWRELATASLALEATLFEAEAVWGGRLSEVAKSLWNLERELRRNLEMHLRSLKDLDYLGKISPERAKRVPEIVYADYPTENKDSFAEQIQAAISEFNALLRPHFNPGSHV